MRFGDPHSLVESVEEQGDGIEGQGPIRLGEEEGLLPNDFLRRTPFWTMVLQVGEHLVSPVDGEGKPAFLTSSALDSEGSVLAVHITEAQPTQLRGVHTSVQQDPQNGPVACCGSIL